MQITVNQKALNAFRRRALRRFPKEYIESLWGYKNGHWRICEFRPMEHESHRITVEYNPEDARTGARDGKLMCIGTIHTHTIQAADCSPSEHDWDDCSINRELITGICSIEAGKSRRRTRIRFFKAQAVCEVDLK